MVTVSQNVFAVIKVTLYEKTRRNLQYVVILGSIVNEIKVNRSVSTRSS